MKDIFRLTTSAAWRKLAHQCHPNKQGKEGLWQGGQFHAIGYLSLAPYSTEDGSHHLTEVANEDTIAACSLSLYRACILLCYRHIINKDYQQAQIDCHQAILYLYKALERLRMTTKLEHREIASRARCFINSLASQAELQQARLNRKIASHLVFVLGMHRSGTSAITGMLAKAGFAAPSDLMEANIVNPKGFWESISISKLNNDFLEQMESHWSSSLALTKEWNESICARKWRSSLLDIIAKSFGGAELPTIKDPRLCMLIAGLEPWLESRLIETSFIITIRSPLEVCNSLKLAQGTDLQISLLLWIKSIIMAEEATRGYKRVFITYDALLQDPKIALETCIKLVRSFDDQVPSVRTESYNSIAHPASFTEATSFIDPSLRRQRAIINDEVFLTNNRRNIDKLITIAERIYSAVQENMENDRTISKLLDEVRESWENILA